MTDAERGILADVAQLVEYGLAEARVAGSSPVVRSKKKKFKYKDDDNKS